MLLKNYKIFHYFVFYNQEYFSLLFKMSFKKLINDNLL